jgi:hypothetical protein
MSKWIPARHSPFEGFSRRLSTSKTCARKSTSTLTANGSSRAKARASLAKRIHGRLLSIRVDQSDACLASASRGDVEAVSTIKANEARKSSSWEQKSRWRSNRMGYHIEFRQLGGAVAAALVPKRSRWPNPGDTV